MNKSGFQESICLCFVILVACMSALVSVKFNSHLFPVQCLIKESHILIDGLEVQHEKTWCEWTLI